MQEVRVHILSAVGNFRESNPRTGLQGLMDEFQRSNQN